MKHTKSMIYKPTAESEELYLTAANDGDLYRRLTLPVLHNLIRYYKKGVFDQEKAADALYIVATAASDQYYKDFGYRFSVTERYTAAVDLVSRYMDYIKENA